MCTKLISNVEILKKIIIKLCAKLFKMSTYMAEFYDRLQT